MRFDNSGSDLFSGLYYSPWLATVPSQRGDYRYLQAEKLEESCYYQWRQVRGAKLCNSLGEEPEISLWLREDLELERGWHLAEPSDELQMSLKHSASLVQIVCRSPGSSDPDLSTRGPFDLETFLLDAEGEVCIIVDYIGEFFDQLSSDSEQVPCYLAQTTLAV